MRARVARLAARVGSHGLAYSPIQESLDFFAPRASARIVGQQPRLTAKLLQQLQILGGNSVPVPVCLRV